MQKLIGTVKFIETKVVKVDDRYYYVWPLSEKTKLEIKSLLDAPDLNFGFANTLEIAPRFHCSECAEEITFLDYVREGLNAMKSPHSKQQFVELLQKDELFGNGVEHHISCKNGHSQPIVMGWPTGFGWIYKEENNENS